MKILSSFNTKLDENLLKEKIEEYWENNVFLIKRHWLYLLWMFFFWIFMIATLWLLIYILNISLNTTDFIIIVSLNLLWVWLWLILTFYQLFKYLSHYNFLKQTISKEELKDGILEKYLKFSFILFIYQIILMIITSILMIQNNPWDITDILLNIWQVFISFIFLYLIYKILYILINFEMDFVLISPENISFYNQSWLFRRESKAIWVEKIKSIQAIQANKKWVIRALFDFGEIIILTEWDEAWKWEVRLKYIPKPDKIKNKILHLMKL